MFPVRIILLMVLLLLPSSPGFAGQQQLLTPEPPGISPLKVYFDVNVGVAIKLETRLRLINTTYDQLLQQGSRPQFIIGFRGRASYFVTKDKGYVEAADHVFKEKIHQWVKTFHARGIRMEQCGIAAGLTGIETSDFLPEVEVVDNGYVAMIIYQNKGFSQIPMD